MSLLDDIVETAGNGARPLADVLRKCTVLAVRLDNPPFRRWVALELEGYGVDDDLPPYRSTVPTELKANLANLAYRVTNALISPLALPADLREDLTSIDCRQSVAEMEGLVRDAHKGGHGSLRVNVDPSLWQFVPVADTYNITDLWQEIQLSKLTAVLDAVRNRALAFALEIERLDPAAGEPNSTRATLPVESVTQIFHTVITGGVVTLAAGAAHVTQVLEVTVNPHDLPSLLARLRQLGIGEADVEDLQVMLPAYETSEPDIAAPGPQVSGWIWRAAVKLGSVGGGVGTSAAAGVLATAVARYLGLG